MEKIMDGLKRRLREAGPDQWEQIATGAGVTPRLPQRIMYGERENLGVRYVQALLDELDARDRAAPRRRGSRRAAARPEA